MDRGREARKRIVDGSAFSCRRGGRKFLRFVLATGLVLLVSLVHAVQRVCAPDVYSLLSRGREKKNKNKNKTKTKTK